MRLELFADYHQFYLQDDDLAVGDLGAAWTDDAVQRTRVAVAPRAVGVGTDRPDTVEVELEVLPAEPRLDPAGWSHIVEADLECVTGRIVVAGCTDFFPDARRVPVEPGRYRVRVLHGQGRAPGGGRGDATWYRVELWRASRARPVEVVKQGRGPWQGTPAT